MLLKTPSTSIDVASAALALYVIIVSEQPSWNIQEIDLKDEGICILIRGRHISLIMMHLSK